MLNKKTKYPNKFCKVQILNTFVPYEKKKNNEKFEI